MGLTDNITKSLNKMGGNFEEPRKPQKEEPRTGMCPDCKKEVSKLATMCPHCGRPLKREDILENPIAKPFLQRTIDDERFIRQSRGETTNKSGGTGVIGIVFAIIIAVILLVILLPKLTSPQVQGVLQELKK